MHDDTRLLRKAALELSNLDPSNVVKVAGVLHRISGIADAELSSGIKKLRSAIEKIDLSLYEDSLNAVQNILQRRLSKTAQNNNSIAAVPGMANQSDWFRWYLVNKSRELGLNPDCIATVMAFESGVNASLIAKNRATGLIMLMPAFSKQYGGPEGLSKMSAESQLKSIVIPHFASFQALRGDNNCGDYYMANFLPAFIRAPNNTVLGKAGSNKVLYGHTTLGQIYRANSGFDQDRKGWFTVGDVRNLLNKRMATWSQRRIEVPSREPQPPSQQQEQQNQGLYGTLTKDYDSLMKLLLSQGPVEKIVRRAIERQKLPNNNMVIVIGNENSLAIRARYARILACALREQLGAEVSVHHENNNIELTCNIAGNKKTALAAVSEFSDGVAKNFSGRVGRDKINTVIFPNVQSRLPIITSEFSENSFRKFAFEVMNHA